MYTNIIQHSRWQVGMWPSHWPLSWHTRKLLPTRLNPLLHLYFTMDPRKVDPTHLFPLRGSPGSPQSTTMCKLPAWSQAYRWVWGTSVEKGELSDQTTNMHAIHGLLVTCLRVQVGGCSNHRPQWTIVIYSLTTNQTTLSDRLLGNPTSHVQYTPVYTDSLLPVSSNKQVA